MRPFAARITKAAAPSARRAFSQRTTALRSPMAIHVDTLGIWGGAYAEPAQQQSAADGLWARSQQWLDWSHWHMPDKTIAERSALLATTTSTSTETQSRRTDVSRDSFLFAAGDKPVQPPQPQPTESEEDVVADRSEDDPLPQGLHHQIKLPAGEAGPRPTESEEDVAADRSEEDPLPPEKHHRIR